MTLSAYKRCKRCGQEFPRTTEFFHRAGKYLQSYCLPNGCEKAYFREYNVSYKGVRRERDRVRRVAMTPEARDAERQRHGQWRDNNREHVNAKVAEWIAAHPDRRREISLASYYRRHAEVCEKNRKRYIERRAVILARQAAYQAAHPERRKAARKKWDDANHIRRAGYRAKRRALMAGARIEPRISYVGILRDCGRHCHICDKPILLFEKLHFDHIIPLARGGAHSRSNLAPAHDGCNYRKGTKLLAELN